MHVLSYVAITTKVCGMQRKWVAAQAYFRFIFDKVGVAQMFEKYWAVDLFEFLINSSNTRTSIEHNFAGLMHDLLQK